MSKVSIPLVLFLTLLGAGTLHSSTPNSSVENLNWALDHAEACRERLLGALEDFRSTGAEGIVVVLRGAASDGRETQVVLEKRGDRSATLRARTLPEGLVEQMAKLHGAAADEAPDIICSRVTSESFVITTTSIAEQYLREFRELTLSPVLSTPLPLDGDS